MENLKYWIFSTNKGRLTTASLFTLLIGAYFYLTQEGLQQRVERTAGGQLPEGTVVKFLNKEELKFKVDFPEFPNFIRCRTDISDKILGKDVNAYFSQTECMTEPGGCFLIDRETKQAIKCGGFVDAGDLETGDLCSDGDDNDGNGKTDCNDPNCSGVGECPTEDECTNKQDDDGDGLVDCKDTDCSEEPSCSVKSAESLTVNAVDMNVCPGFARNEQEYEFQTSLFRPVLVTPSTNSFGATLLSVDEGILKPFSLSDSNQLECCGTKEDGGCSTGMTSKKGCIQGLTRQEYTVCGSISSDAKIHVGNQEFTVRPDDILVNALYFKLLQKYSKDSTKVANSLCKVPTSKVEHFGNVSAVVTASNISKLPKQEEYLDKDLQRSMKYFIEQNPQKNLCFVFSKLDPSFVPSALSFFVNAPYQTSTSMSDARVSSLFQKMYTNASQKKNFTQWASFATDLDNAYVDSWYAGVKKAFTNSKGGKIKPPSEGVNREQIAKAARGSGGFVANSLEELECVGECVQEKINFTELATAQEIRAGIDRCKSQKQGCCTFYNVMNPAQFLGDGRSLPEERDPSILALFTHASTTQMKSNSQCIGQLYRMIAESTEIRKGLLQKFDEKRGVPNQGRDIGNNVRLGGLLPSNIEVKSGQSLRNSKPKLTYPTTDESCELTLAWDQNTPELRSVAQTIKNLVNEKDTNVILSTPAQGVDVGGQEQFDVLLGMQPYYTTKSLPSIKSFLITDASIGRKRFPFGDDKVGKCGDFMCDAYRKMAFEGFSGNADDQMRFMKTYEKCLGNTNISMDRTFYLEKCEEYYQQSKTPVLILDYYVPYQFSVGPDCQ